MTGFGITVALREPVIIPIGAILDALDAHPAGWYSDPRNPGCVRWWNGSAWTGHVTRPMYGMPLLPPVVPRSGSSRTLRALLVGAFAVLVVASAVVIANPRFDHETTVYTDTRSAEVLEGYADFADSMCACENAACARAVDARFQHWASDLSRRATKLAGDADFTKAALVSAQRYASCFASK